MNGLDPVRRLGAGGGGVGEGRGCGSPVPPSLEALSFLPSWGGESAETPDGPSHGTAPARGKAV